ncbi:unnamed protein product [Caenorhabditis brenneri]
MPKTTVPIFDFTPFSRHLLHSRFLASYFYPGENDYTEYLKTKRLKILGECSKVKKEDECTDIVNNGVYTFCKWTNDFDFCKDNANLKLVEPPTTTTTTTTTTAAPATTAALFPLGTLIGGFSVGAFLGAVLMILVLFMCRKSKKSHPDTGYPTATTPTASTGTTSTTTGTTGTTGTKTEKKKKGKKNKKEKKAKKNKKNKKNTTQSTETKTATAY